MSEMDVKEFKERKWVIISLFGSLFFLYVLFGRIVPLIVEIVDMQKTLQENSDRMDKVDASEITYHQLEEEKRQLQTQIEQFVFGQKQDTHLSKILAYLSRCAKEREIRIVSIKPQDIVTAQRYVIVPIQVNMISRFHDLGYFINRIETSEWIIKIEYLKVAAQNMTSDILHVEMTLLLYFLEKSA